MCTTTKTKSKCSSDIFPQSVKVYEESLIYMKRLTAVAISNILYLRNIFNEDCYGHRKLGNIKLRILSEKSPSVAATQIVSLVKGCFDALDHKYLRQLTLGIFTDPENSDQLIESYSFTFRYSDDNRVQISVNDKTLTESAVISSDKDLQESTHNLLKSILTLTYTLDKLPEECYLTIKLLYYDDITPVDYEPPGFMAAKTDSFTYDGNPLSIEVGEVSTRFHTLKLKIKANNSQCDDNSIHNSQNSGSKDDTEVMDYERNSSNIGIRADITNRFDFMVDNLSEKPKTSATKVAAKVTRKSSDETIVTSKIKQLNVSDNTDKITPKKSGSIKRKVLNEDLMDSENEEIVFERSKKKVEKKLKASATKGYVNLGNRFGF